MMKSIAALALLGAAEAQSVSSCGQAGDHFSNVKITLSPDPPKLGSPFSFDMEGDLDELFDGGSAAVDLNVKALGIINEPVKVTAPFTYSPGAPSGHSKISVGPVNLPKIPLPGGVDVTGTVKVTNAKQESVACVQLNLNVGANEAQPVLKDSPVTDCTKASDHMKNFKFSDDPSGITTITGTLDEDVSKLTVAAALTIKIPLIPLPEIDLSVPVSISPAIKSGDQKVTVGPTASALSYTGSPISVSGSVKINDGNSEEIVCLNIASATQSIVV